MKLIIMRHGEASGSSASDFDRTLTATGRREVATTASKLVESIQIDRVIASPYLRARQTGQIVADEQGCSMTLLESLTPDGQPLTVIEQLPASGVVLLASHMPIVGQLSGLLCDGSTRGGPGFSTAHALILEMDFPAAGLASIVGWVTPH
ncbi:phosphohistidine phosphatase SixA [Endozoicomonas sp. (ex Bugula neritina AB1)]|nr:phosphohistidine phosphatase SixA [Endozoicomonas sp. (ex Bugula neritina AB1)]